MSGWHQLWSGSNAPMRTALVISAISGAFHLVALFGPDRAVWYELVALLVLAAIGAGWWMLLHEFRRRRMGSWDPMSPLPQRLPRAPFWIGVLLLIYTVIVAATMPSEVPIIQSVGLSDSGRVVADARVPDGRDAAVARLFSAAVPAILFTCVIILTFAQRWGKYYGTRDRAA